MFHRSERLLLRPGWLEDAGELFARIADEAIVRNLANAPWPYRQEDAESWLAQPKSRKFPTFLLTLPGASGSPIIGACGLGEAEQGPEIGYWVARDYWGQGYATEAARAVLSIARTLGHRRIHSLHAADNPASGRVLRKAGFVPTGRLRMIHSLGRNADMTAVEYATELDGCVGGDDPAMMPQAA